MHERERDRERKRDSACARVNERKKGGGREREREWERDGREREGYIELAHVRMEERRKLGKLGVARNMKLILLSRPVNVYSARGNRNIEFDSNEDSLTIVQSALRRLYGRTFFITRGSAVSQTVRYSRISENCRHFETVTGNLG